MKLKRIFREPETEGIFEYIDFDFGISNSTLNTIYFKTWSGEKEASEIVFEKLTNLQHTNYQNIYGDTIYCDTADLSQESLEQLGNLLYNRFNLQWTKLKNTLSLQYNPIHNYDLTEDYVGDNSYSSTVDVSSDSDITNTGTQQLGTTETLTHTGTDTLLTTHNNTDTTTYGHITETDFTNSSNGGTYGFNSGTAIPSSTVSDTQDTSVTNSGTDSVAHSGTVTNQTTKNLTDGTSGTQTRTDNLREQNSTDLNRETTSTTENNHTLTRSGNIGITTSQQMIDAERKLWYWSFFEKVFDDLDKILTKCIILD